MKGLYLDQRCIDMKKITRCDKCKFWAITHEYTGKCKENDLSQTNKDEYTGVCHRYPPILDSVFAGKLEDSGEGGAEAEVNCWQQPLTEGVNWCGEFLEN